MLRKLQYSYIVHTESYERLRGRPEDEEAVIVRITAPQNSMSAGASI